MNTCKLKRLEYSRANSEESPWKESNENMNLCFKVSNQSKFSVWIENKAESKMIGKIYLKNKSGSNYATYSNAQTIVYMDWIKVKLVIQ